MSNVYIQGFIDKCAEAGVDPEQLVKSAFGGAGIAKLKGLSPEKLIELARTGFKTTNAKLHTGIGGEDAMSNLLAVGQNKGMNSAETLEGIIKNRDLLKQHAQNVRTTTKPYGTRHLNASEYPYDFIGRREMPGHEQFDFADRLRDVTTNSMTSEGMEAGVRDALIGLRSQRGAKI